MSHMLKVGVIIEKDLETFNILELDNNHLKKKVVKN